MNSEFRKVSEYSESKAFLYTIKNQQENLFFFKYTIYNRNQNYKISP